MHVAQDPRMALENILQNDEPSDPPSCKRILGQTHSLGCLQSCLRAPRACGPQTSTPSPTVSPVAMHDDTDDDRWNSWQVQTPSRPYPSEVMARKPRAPRPSYSEEQKFYIMFCRIMCDQSWPEIEDGYTAVFGGRTKGGLTSIYYRVRKDWGMCEVLKSGPETIAQDQDAITRRASHFSTEFLGQIGYLEKDPQYSHYQRGK